MKEGKINKRISSLHCAFLQKHRIAVPKSPVSVIQIRFLSASSGLPGRRYSRILFALFILPGSAMEVWNNVSVTGDWADTMADLLLLLQEMLILIYKRSHKSWLEKVLYVKHLHCAAKGQNLGPCWLHALWREISNVMFGYPPSITSAFTLHFTSAVRGADKPPLFSGIFGPDSSQFPGINFHQDYDFLSILGCAKFPHKESSL